MQQFASARQLQSLLCGSLLLVLGAAPVAAQTFETPVTRSAALPMPAFSVEALDFGTLEVGQTSATQVVELRNTNELPATIAALSVVGGADGSTADWVVTTSQSLPITIGPKDKVDVTVQFAPIGKGSRQASLVAVPAARGATTTPQVTLRGIGLGTEGNEVDLNAGGPSYVGGSTWSADFGFTGGTVLQTPDSISGTGDVPLLQTGREAQTLAYSFDVGSGNYLVRLTFAELEAIAPNRRVFDVFAEGLLYLDDLDLFAVAGHDAALVRSFVVPVADGRLDLVFVSSIGEALVNAIEISTAPELTPDIAAFDFGAVTGGTTDQLDLTLENTGIAPVFITQVEFLQGPVGDSADFSIDLGGNVLDGGLSDVSHAVFAALLPGQDITVPIFYSPADELLHEFTLRFTGNFLPVEVNVQGLGGHFGHPFLHVVIAQPGDDVDYEGKGVVVDYDGNGTEDLFLDGTDSHTHEPNQNLVGYDWFDGPTPIGSGVTLTAPFGLGEHTVALQITDDNVPAEVWTDSTTFRVHSVDQIPGVRAFYYDAGASQAADLIDALPAQADFAEVIDSFLIDNDGSAGGSPFTLNFLVKLEATIEIDTPGNYRFDVRGGVAKRIDIGGSSGTETVTVNLAAGTHLLEARFAAEILGQLPLRVLWDAGLGGGPQLIPESIINHDDSSVAPVINDMPANGIDLGGNEILIEGYGFFPDASVVVHWGGTDFTQNDFTELTPTTILFNSPPGSGAIQVSVETPQGVSNPRTFTYSPTGPVPIDFDDVSFVNDLTKPTAGRWGPDGRLYMGSLSGNIYAITYDENYQPTDVQTYDGTNGYIGTQGLNTETITGMAINPWDPPSPVRLYVAHNMINAWGGSTITGPAEYAGQISVLEGPDFDTPVPLITGLPMSNHDHFVNGIEFDNNGDLLICVGSNTNAGITYFTAGDLPESPLSAAILKAETSRPDFNGTITYVHTGSGLPSTDQRDGETVDVSPGVHVAPHAVGTRNSYDLVLTTKERVYASDNGPNNGFGPASTGMGTQGPDPFDIDEVMFIEAGNYYGSPNLNRARYDEREYVYHNLSAPLIPGEFTQSLTGVPSSTNGILEYRSDIFGGQLRGNILAQKMGSKPRRIELNDWGDEATLVVQMSDFIGALDLVMGPGGALVGMDYGNNRVRALMPDDPTAVGLQVHDITPWRAPATGGYPFVIGGVGFGTLGDTSVTIGGLTATLDEVSATRIKGTIPANPSPTTDLLDVVVTVGGSSDTHFEAFRYLLPIGTEPGEWFVGPDANTFLGEVACGVIDGKIYVVGESNGKTMAWDVHAKWWNNNLTPREFKGHHHGAEVYDDKLYLIGGLSAGSEGKVQIYDPDTNSWTLGADMPVGWEAGSVNTALIGDKIYVSGGIVGGGTVNDTGMYDPVLDTWTYPLANMPVGRNHAASATDGEKLYVFGGRSGCNCVTNGFDDVQIYDPVADTWEWDKDGGSSLAPLPIGRGGMGKAVFYQGEFYVIGGETLTGPGATASGVYDRVDVYDPVTNTWRQDAPMPTARHGIYPVLYQSKIFVACGGIQAAGSASTLFEVFTRQ